MKFTINADRLWNNLMDIAQITKADLPYTRRSFSDEFLQGRDYLTQKMEAAGLEVSIDKHGNLRGLLKGYGSLSRTLATGSHSDTVPAGGRFDGVAGVIAAIEVAQSIQDHKIKLRHDLEIIDFLAEEPSEWGISCVGSRGLTGNLPANIKHPQTGELLADAIVRIGATNLDPQKVYSAFVELHIEQGNSLEAKKLDIGAVTGIVGIIRLEIIFNGKANHAGTTPMELRNDSLTASSQLILVLEKMAKEYDTNHKSYFVATCGQIFNTPNASNVIPGQTKLIFDIRSDDDYLLNKFADQLLETANQIAEQRQISMTSQILSTSKPTLSDPTIVETIEKAATLHEYSYQRMSSGAGHDTAFISLIAPTAMIFVPSLDGLSHNPKEYTSPEQLTAGVNVLLQTIIELDKIGV